MWQKELIHLLGDVVRLDLPLAKHTAFKVGGPADAFVRPKRDEQLATALRFARQRSIPITVLGAGSNVIVSDLGIRGITIRLAGELAAIHAARSGEVEAGAGALNATLVSLALNMGLSGLEFLGTIPGTVGGALIMNAGAFGSEIAPFVREVRLIRDLELLTRTAEECGFGYRSSRFSPGEIITTVRLDLPRGDTTEAKFRLKELREKRRAKQPRKASAGSMFKNPPGDFAGRLIETCGLKGYTRGAAAVSEIHANFIVNTGGATASDIVALAKEVQATVYRESNIELQWEVRRIGDWSVDDRS